MQSRVGSFLEANANLVAGYLFTIAMYSYVLPQWFNIPIRLQQGIWITVIFTLFSFLRQYSIRRLFVWWERRESLRDNRRLEEMEEIKDYTRQKMELRELWLRGEILGYCQVTPTHIHQWGPSLMDFNSGESIKRALVTDTCACGAVRDRSSANESLWTIQEPV